MSNARHKKVEGAIKELKDLYEFGQSLSQMIGPVKRISKSQKEKIKQDYNDHPINDEWIRKSRQFVKEYPIEERDKFFQRIREKQSDHEVSDPVFGITHLFRILSVKLKNRGPILTLAFNECWGLTTLEDEIGKRFGSRKQAGRRIKAPKTFSDFLIRLDSLCESWRRLKKGITDPPKKARGKHYSWDDLPLNFQPEFQKISDQLLSFHKEVEAHLKNFAKGRIPRLALENDAKKERPNPVKG